MLPAMSKPQEESPFHCVATTSRKVLEGEKRSLPPHKTLTVTLLSSEWKSVGGVSTIIRELAIQLAEHPDVEVYVYLPKCSEEDKKVAGRHNVQLIEADKLPGFEPIDWLASLPKGHLPHCLIGHGLHLGRQIPLIKRHHDCKWIQVVHTAPEELVMFKSYEEAIFKGERKHQTEAKLCERADQVVAVGPKLADAYYRYLRFRRKDQDVINLTPSIFTEFLSVQQATEERGTFFVLVFGRGDIEDFVLKGYDIAVQAVAELKDSSYNLMFVGAPAGKEDEVAETLLQYGIRRSQLTVRHFKESREELARLFCEVDLAIMPSRTEGFGLIALEALSAGLPVLVSGNSGLGDALKKVSSGFSHVVDSKDPKDWAKAIGIVRQKGREVRLKEANLLRENYALKYSWRKQCDRLVEKMIHLSFGNIQDKLERVQSQVENASKKMDNLGKLKEPYPEAVPPEIVVRGRLALEAYNKALAEGTTFDRRVPVMLIGRDRSGKTSLKKSLMGELFNPNEESTVGIDVDLSHFELSTEIWKIPEKDQEANSGMSISYEHHVARAAVEHMMQTRRDPVPEEKPPSENVPAVETVSASASISTHDPAEVGTVSSSKTSIQENRFERTSNDPNELPMMSSESVQTSRHAENEDRKPDIPSDVQTEMIKFLENNSEVGDEEVHAVLWDFAGQSVYYTTHPIFLTPRAIYLLAYDLSQDPHEEAQPVQKQGLFEEFADSCGLEINSDYLDFWMSSVASLASQEEFDEVSSKSEDKLSPDKLPVVLLVCTHADTPYDRMRGPKKMANELYGSLRKKPYKMHLRSFFLVDNTKSGRGPECPGVKKLREELQTVAKQLPQMKESIPIKWLNYEKKLRAKRKLGEKWIDLQEAKRTASEECNIVDEREFRAVLDFLHDKRILIHFNDSPELDKLVVLDPQWLVDVFKKVITIPPYDSKENEFEDLWDKLQKKGILDEKLVHHVWRTLSFDKKTTESLLKIMEKFSLLCSCPSSGASCGEQYLMPSMLKTYPPKDITRLVEAASAQIPPLFIKFKSGLVPPGLFPRLVLLFLQWGKENSLNPVKPLLYHNFARCFISKDTSQSVILLCLSSFIKVFVHRGDGIQESMTSLAVDVSHDGVTFAGSVCKQLELILASMRKEFSWLRNMRYKLGFICPVCCQGGVAVYCDTHGDGCKREECFHFWSLSHFRNPKKAIDCNEFAGAPITRVDTRPFEPWFAYQSTVDEHNEERLANLEVLLVKNEIVSKIHVMDEIAHLLDQPICHGNQDVPSTQYWFHLAEEFKVPEKIVIRCQHNPDNSPSKNMLEFQEARDPYFSVQTLKDALRDIGRNDLVEELEQSSLADTATVVGLRVDHPETFESICLQLDHNENWQALGKTICIPHETLQRVSTSSSCTKTVLNIIEKRKPELTVNKMKAALKDMERQDVCEELNKLSGDSTITSLLEDLDLLDKVAIKLDRETPGLKNWLHFAWTFGIPKNECDVLKPKGNPSPTIKLMEHIVQINPDLTVKQLIQTLKKMKRLDVVNALTKHLAAKVAVDESH